jgi:hypothetical protein
MIALLAILLLVPAGDVGRAEQGDWSDCLGPDFERRVTGCSRLIEGTDLTAEERGHAYANRALAHAVHAYLHSSGAIASYLRANKELAHDARNAGRSVA